MTPHRQGGQDSTAFSFVASATYTSLTLGVGRHFQRALYAAAYIAFGDTRTAPCVPLNARCGERSKDFAINNGRKS